jgi:hypothetical protein
MSWCQVFENFFSPDAGIGHSSGLMTGIGKCLLRAEQTRLSFLFGGLASCLDHIQKWGRVKNMGIKIFTEASGNTSLLCKTRG